LQTPPSSTNPAALRAVHGLEGANPEPVRGAHDLQEEQVESVPATHTPEYVFLQLLQDALKALGDPVTQAAGEI
jgi:hypothetical protein